MLWFRVLSTLNVILWSCFANRHNVRGRSTCYEFWSREIFVFTMNLVLPRHFNFIIAVTARKWEHSNAFDCELLTSYSLFLFNGVVVSVNAWTLSKILIWCTFHISNNIVQPYKNAHYLCVFILYYWYLSYQIAVLSVIWKHTLFVCINTRILIFVIRDSFTRMLYWSVIWKHTLFMSINTKLLVFVIPDLLIGWL